MAGIWAHEAPDEGLRKGACLHPRKAAQGASSKKMRRPKGLLNVQLVRLQAPDTLRAELPVDMRSVVVICDGKMGKH